MSASETQDAEKRLLPLAVAAIGVVFGDIGTSPLYTMREAFTGPHPMDSSLGHVLGVLSLIVWTQVIVVTLKYVTYILRADNRGEGGMFALMALAMKAAPAGIHRGVPIMAAGLFGASLFFGDAIITPAISVLSAVEGLKVAAPDLEHYVVPISCVILIGLFMFQRYGTALVGAFFGPVTIIWFLVLAALGIFSIVQTPYVLVAINPYYGLHFLLSDGWRGFLVMGAVFLALTGAEALYADIGHFGKRPIRLAWVGFVQPALLLNYFGQGALLMRQPDASANPFFLMVPDVLLLPIVFLATTATVIASQAVITGAFSLSRQAIQLGYLPRMEIRHTSETEIGQIYIPRVNWLLCACVIALVVGFQSSSALASAYGVSVSGEMCVATLIAYVVARHIWGWSRLQALAVTVVFLSVDLLFFMANFVKIADGGWMPLLVGAGLYATFTTWKRGRRILVERLHESTVPLEPFIGRLREGNPPRVAGTAVFMTGTPDGVPYALLHNLKHNKVLHERVVLLTVMFEQIPQVPQKDRIQVEILEKNFWRVTLRYGFMEAANIPRALRLAQPFGLKVDMMDTSFFFGRENLVMKSKPLMPRWREKLFIALSRSAYSATAFFSIPSNRVVELGTQVEI
ncbi:MAG: potassium transporter Kup [Alphaproteobacteria bacterium]|nr:potassium transporter Kup [Alphaproteobacteria bacterium]